MTSVRIELDLNAAVAKSPTPLTDGEIEVVAGGCAPVEGPNGEPQSPLQQPK